MIHVFMIFRLFIVPIWTDWTVMKAENLAETLTPNSFSLLTLLIVPSRLDYYVLKI